MSNLFLSKQLTNVISYAVQIPRFFCTVYTDSTIVQALTKT